jgi:serine/threonine-protein kinase
MPISIGTQLGSHEITALLGKGGMGEVYRARDLKLKREVAIKILPEEFSQDTDRVIRFQREAEVLASLNHPNIATIYDLEETNGTRYLVLELVEGETLADRISVGPIPVEEALNIAIQISEALEAAHERGIIHRDLKPANVKLTPDGKVKVLDFGLARAADRNMAGTTLSNSPTLSLAATSAGVIMGTAGYMSPEQARGKPVDKRADIWAFGVVLYEMLTGKQLFQGEDIVETLAAVVHKQPDLAQVPERVRRLLDRCLQKDPNKRLRDIGSMQFLLTDSTPAAIPQPTLQASRLPWFLSGAAILIAAIALWALYRATRPVDHPLIRLSVDLGPDAVVVTNVTAAISPDGTRIVFPIRGGSGQTMLATRPLDQATPTPIAGTEDASMPFFSPDGKWIGFLATGKLKKISVLGGAALTLAGDILIDRGASWGDDGNIVYATENRSGLWRVAETGGTPQQLTKPAERGEATHRWPQVLPKANAVLFTAKAPDLGTNLAPGYDDANIEVLSLKTREIKNLIRGGYYARYVPESGSMGHLVYLHQGVLFGVPFDLDRLEVRGSPAPLLEDIAADAIAGGGQFDVSGTPSGAGTLVYLGGKASSQQWPVMWLDSSGKTEPLLKPGIYNALRFSPDGNWLALAVANSSGRDVYVYDWRHDTMPRLTFNNQLSNNPVWAPDGKHIAYETPDGIYWVRSDGAGQPQRLLESSLVFPSSFSPDGKRLAYTSGSGQGTSIWTLPLDLNDPEHPRPGKPEQLVNAGFGGIFSPDARWMVYESSESTPTEVCVRPFPGPVGKWQISAGGGRFPVWSRNGRELFFASRDDRIMVTEYTTKGDSFNYTKPRAWVEKQINFVNSRRYFDLAPDGKRFAVFTRTGLEDKQGNLHVVFLLNFFDEIRRRIPLN